MGYKWDRETIATCIRRRASRGRSLKAAEVKRESPHLYYAARYHFGAYSAAVGFALDLGPARTETPPRCDEWTPERVVSEIRTGYAAGLDLSYTAVRGKPLMRHAKRLFGSWRAAVETAGIEYVEIRRYGWGIVRSLKGDGAVPLG